MTIKAYRLIWESNLTSLFTPSIAFRYSSLPGKAHATSPSCLFHSVNLCRLSRTISLYLSFPSSPYTIFNTIITAANNPTSAGALSDWCRSGSPSLLFDNLGAKLQCNVSGIDSTFASRLLSMYNIASITISAMLRKYHYTNSRVPPISFVIRHNMLDPLSSGVYTPKLT
jgi:hypothetical protein